MAALKLPELMVPAIEILASGLASQRLTSAPGLEITGVSPQVMVRVAVGLVPVHPALPVSVSVAVKLPDWVLGVKTARAGSAFWTQLPRPTPPVQVAALKLPVAVVPAILIPASGVASQRWIAGPAAVMVGVWPQVIRRVPVGFVPVQLPVPVRVRVAVNEPETDVGVKTANAGSAFWVQLPRAAPPVQFAAL
jgi:hypothetical protein